ncbi:hypothetical protein RM572_21770 [Streptomyces sp. DSM 42041]|uniref:Uncharacterized protein n=1 Tax=Streptomyces hazeniae TaxID=3075538 RepID=A0ABU2NWL5_9ACTN|nr:hypothetical protein [Streptomyces sp. DSM 42041]MDT0381390.1 hypothetical protein [Streptomyces sp. DSM 42041]
MPDRIVSPRDDAAPRRFVLSRAVDVSGVSGTGDVADGVLWPDGTASVRWRGEHPSTVFWDRGRASVELIHGHGGATQVLFLDADEAPARAVDEPAGWPLPVRRAVDHALTAPVPCPSCSRTVPCRCAKAPRTEGRVTAVLEALRPWLRGGAS